MSELHYFRYLDLSRHILIFLDFPSQYQLYGLVYYHWRVDQVRELSRAKYLTEERNLQEEEEESIYQIYLTNILNSISAIHSGYCNPILSLLRSKNHHQRLFKKENILVSQFLSVIFPQLKDVTMFFPKSEAKCLYFPFPTNEDLELTLNFLVTHQLKDANTVQGSKNIFTQFNSFIVATEPGYHFPHAEDEEKSLALKINRFVMNSLLQEKIHDLQYLCLDYASSPREFSIAHSDWTFLDPHPSRTHAPHSSHRPFSLIESLNLCCPFLKRADVSRQLTIFDYFAILSRDFQWTSLQELDFYPLFLRLRTIGTQLSQKHAHLRQLYFERGLARLFEDRYYEDDDGQPLIHRDDDQDDDEDAAHHDTTHPRITRNEMVVDLISLLLSTYKFPRVRKLELNVENSETLLKLFQLIFHCFVHRSSSQPLRSSDNFDRDEQKSGHHRYEEKKCEGKAADHSRTAVPVKEKQFLGEKISALSFLLLDQLDPSNANSNRNRLRSLLTTGSFNPGNHSSYYRGGDDVELEEENPFFADDDYLLFQSEFALKQQWNRLFFQQPTSSSGPDRNYPILSNPAIEKYCLFPVLQTLRLAQDIPISYFMFLFNQRNPSLAATTLYASPIHSTYSSFSGSRSFHLNTSSAFVAAQQSGSMDSEDHRPERSLEDLVFHSASPPMEVVVCDSLCSEFMSFLTNLYPSQRWNIHAISLLHDTQNNQRHSLASFLSGVHPRVSMTRSYLPLLPVPRPEQRGGETKDSRADRQEEEEEEQEDGTDIYAVCRSWTGKQHDDEDEDWQEQLAGIDFHVRHMYADHAFRINCPAYSLDRLHLPATTQRVPQSRRRQSSHDDDDEDENGDQDRDRREGYDEEAEIIESQSAKLTRARREISRRAHKNFCELSEKFFQCLTETNSIEFLQHLAFPVLYLQPDFLNTFLQLLEYKLVLLEKHRHQRLRHHRRLRHRPEHDYPRSHHEQHHVIEEETSGALVGSFSLQLFFSLAEHTGDFEVELVRRFLGDLLWKYREVLLRRKRDRESAQRAAEENEDELDARVRQRSQELRAERQRAEEEGNAVRLVLQLECFSYDKWKRFKQHWQRDFLSILKELESSPFLARHTKLVFQFFSESFQVEF